MEVIIAQYLKDNQNKEVDIQYYDYIVYLMNNRVGIKEFCLQYDIDNVSVNKIYLNTYKYKYGFDGVEILWII